MKKIVWKILVAVLVVILFIAIRPIRTTTVMKNIAVNEFEDIPMYDSLRMQLKGPIIYDKGKYLEYRWFKVLKWGDSAIMNIDVFKSLNSFSWRDDFFWPRVTMNYKWYYFLFPNGTSKCDDILPKRYVKNEVKFSEFKPIYDQRNNKENSIRFIVKRDRLFFFLQKGYFTIVEKNDEYTIVDFYEPIAILDKINSNRGTIQTITAKIYFNDAMELVIQPIEYY